MRLEAKKTLGFMICGLSWLGQAACSGPQQSAETTVLRGSKAFKTFLAQGAGSSRGAPLEAGAGFGLRARQDGVIAVSLDPASHTWAWVSFDTSKSAHISAESGLLPFAKAFIEEYREELGLLPEELLSFDRTVFQPSAELGLAFVTFNRSFQGRPVKNAFTQLVFNKGTDGSFRLREVLNQSFGPISLSGDAKAPDAAAAMAGADVYTFFSRDAAGKILGRRTTQFKARDQSGDL